MSEQFSTRRPRLHSSKRLLQVVAELEAFGRGDWSTVYLDGCQFGLGVFAARAIGSGESILHFSGHHISFDEAVAKGNRQCYTLQCGLREYIDLEAPGCFVNHSCQPNSGVRGVQLIALREIRTGEHICFDYSTTMEEDYWQMNCRCGAPSCRHVIGDFKYLPVSIQDVYIARDVVLPVAVEAAKRWRLKEIAS